VLMYSTGQNDEIRRLVNTYSPSGLLESCIVYDQLMPGGISARCWFTYDTEGRQTSSGYDWFRASQEGPEMWFRDSTVYDALGNVIMTESETYGYGCSVWPHVREEIQITDSTEVRTHSRWLSGGWLPTSRTTLNTESSSGTTVLLTESWNGAKWVPVSRTTDNAAPGALVTLSLREEWVKKDWEPAWRSTHVRSEDGRSWIDSTEEWNKGVWVPYMRTRRTCDAQGSVIIDLVESWHDGWMRDLRRISMYAHGGSTREIDSSWSEGSLSWTYDLTFGPSGYTEIVGSKSPEGGWSISGWKESESYTPSGQTSES
jgi:hypothetical protein